MGEGKEMYRLLHCCVLCLLLSVTAVAGAQTISGFVEDDNSGERLIGANVFDPDLGIGTSTNAYGFFSLTYKNAQQDSVMLVVSYIGYETWRRRLPLAASQPIDVRLRPGAILADTVTVEAQALGNIAERTEMSVVQIPVRELAMVPALLGEVDVVKSLQLLPGRSIRQRGNERSLHSRRWAGPEPDPARRRTSLQRIASVRLLFGLQLRRFEKRSPHQRRLSGTLWRPPVECHRSEHERGKQPGAARARRYRPGRVAFYGGRAAAEREVFLYHHGQAHLSRSSGATVLA